MDVRGTVRLRSGLYDLALRQADDDGRYRKGDGDEKEEKEAGRRCC